MTLLEYFKKTSDVMVACEVVSLEDIKDKSYEIDFEDAIDFSELWDEPIDLEYAKSVDEYGRPRTCCRY